jgi:hypothetical protein
VTEVPRDELQAAIEARKEVGEDMEPALIDAFVERIERRLEQHGPQSEQALKRSSAVCDRRDLRRLRRDPRRVRGPSRDRSCADALVSLA